MGTGFPPSPDQVFAQAAAHHQAGRLTEAERLYRQVCAADPDHVAALHRLGVVAHQLGRPDAPDILARAVALRPDVAEAHNDLGVVLGARGRLAEAAAAFERAAALRPDYAEAHANLGGALRRLGRTEEAVAHYERVAALAPNSAGAHNNIANALMELGRLDAALAYYDKALALAFPEHSRTALQRAFAAGLVSLGGQVISSDQNLAEGDVNRIRSRFRSENFDGLVGQVGIQANCCHGYGHSVRPQRIYRIK